MVAGELSLDTDKVVLVSTVTVDLPKLVPTGKPLDDVDKFIDVVNALLKVGTFAFPEVKAALEVIAAVGGLIKMFDSLAPSDVDPVMKKLKELETKIDTLADKMNAKFDELKSFITEVNFHEQVILPTSKLMKYMVDCMNHPGKESTENFKNAYQKNKPLDLAYTVLSLLEQDVTNPLRMAMNADVLKTSTTFNKWEFIFKAVLAQFLCLESYANGLVEDGKLFDSERMIERSEKLFEKVKGWREEYIKANGYWDGLKKYLGQFQDETSGMSNKDRADKLKELLDTVMATDALYITISVSSPRVNDFGINTVVDDQLIESYERGNCNAFVYRSKNANSWEQVYFDNLRNDINKCKEGRIPAQVGYKDYPKQLFDNPIRYSGMICLIMLARDPQTRSSNCPKHQWGPGWWDTIKTREDPWHGSMEYRLIAGLK